MSSIFGFWDFDDSIQTALRMLRKDIHDGYRSDFAARTICTYRHMQTRKECRRQRTHVDLMVEIADWLDEQCDVYLWGLPSTIDSPGDFLAVNGLWDGEAA